MKLNAINANACIHTSSYEILHIAVHLTCYLLANLLLLSEILTRKPILVRYK